MSITAMNFRLARYTSKDLSSNESYSSGYPEFSLSATARFWLLLIFEIPSLCCSLLVLFYLITDRTLRQSLHYHVIIALLVVGLFAQSIDVPFYLNFVRINYILPASSITCLLWWFAATGISNITNLLMTWASIERHILVFHDRWLVTKQNRFFIHYLPLMLILLYGFIFYIVVLLIYSCDNTIAFDQDWCLYPCYYNDGQLAIYDTIINSILPTPLIVLFCILLLIRVIHHKHTLQQAFGWRKYRSMIIQLFSICALFLLFNLPMTCLVLAHVFGLPLDSTGQLNYYTYFLYHYVSLLMPFVCLLSLPDVRRKIRRRIPLHPFVNTIGQTSLP